MTAPQRCGDLWRKETVSDRAFRYRATSPACRPPGPPVCAFCGATLNVDVHHIDGHEEHTQGDNVVWACRSCNVLAGNAMRRAGLGRKTVQFNPTSQGAGSLRQWLTAVRSMKGEITDMDTAAAVEMIRATPPERRSEFALKIWEIRRRHGTDRKPT
jgi:hypothetical protein